MHLNTCGISGTISVWLLQHLTIILLPGFKLELWLVGMVELRDCYQSDVAKEYI